MGLLKQGIIYLTGIGLAGGLGFISSVLLLFTIASATEIDNSSTFLMIISAICGLLIGMACYRFVKWGNSSSSI
ncbi:MAG: hypothetical protein ACKVJ7_02275 [Candidatus Poseidoniales archaeon]